MTVLWLALLTCVAGASSLDIQSRSLTADVNPRFRQIRTAAAGAVTATGATPVFINHPDITQIVTSRPSDYTNVRQEAPTPEDELQRSRRAAAAAAVEAEEDDSDMYMEPLEEEEEPAAVPDSQGMNQHFFPSFAPVFPLGHSRPPQLFHQEPVYTKPTRSPQLLRPEYNPFRAYRDNAYKASVDEEVTSQNLLGSGNFGVIRGGTYYNDEDREDFTSDYNQYYNNGHGRPAFVGNPRPQKYNNGDFFANFRDFADINTPGKTAFSEYVIVYVNKNATKAETTEARERPKNIFEQLTLLDQQDEATEKPKKKLSSHKRKLAALRDERVKKESKIVEKKPTTAKDLTEPLLAVS